MSEIKKKVIELGLKNAIVIRTNIDPFKINDPDMETDASQPGYIGSLSSSCRSCERTSIKGLIP